MDASLIEWSRLQFALTAMYHWLFVPLTLGLSFIIAFMETIYVRTGDPKWKAITKFWMKLFGINFAIGVATGLILEFEFGTNWSNYSWFVGDIFGAPLAVEGILAFFMESTFIAIMFFGWNKVSKGFHLTATWLTAVGANLSALWILVANAWMQYPTGMVFNPDTARMEMMSFWEVLFSPMAINKFLHTIQSGFVLAAVFVVGVSAYFLLKNREKVLAKRSIAIASVFGIVMSCFIIITGDGSAMQVAKLQPVKFASMENLNKGQTKAPIVAVGFLKTSEKNENLKDFSFNISVPGILSLMAHRDINAFVPGLEDLIYGNAEQNIESVESKIEKGKLARTALLDYKTAMKAGDSEKAAEHRKVFDQNFSSFGYGFLDKPEDAIPPIGLTFYSFRIMVILGAWFVVLFILTLYFSMKHKIEKPKWLLRAALWSIPLAYIAGQAGWIVAEVGRQPWVIQDLMPTSAAVSNLQTHSVVITFVLFAITFTVLAIAEVTIMVKQINKGSKTEEV